MKKKKVLLTGASGTVGQEVLKQLIEKNQYDIFVFDIQNKKTKQIFAPYQNKVNIIYGDISNKVEVQKIPEGIDFVIHLAAIIPPMADDYPQLAQKVNVEGTRYLIAHLEKTAPNCHLIYSSSISVYGDRVENPNIFVSDPIQISEGDEYAKTKVAAESVLKESSLKWTIFRLAAIMKNHKISKLMFHMPLNTTFEICTPADTARAFVLGLEKNKEIQFQIFNLGGGEESRTSYRHFLERSFKIYGLGALNFPKQAFAERNFHCGAYADGDNLEAILHFRRDNLEDYFQQTAAPVGRFQKWTTRLLSPFIKWYLLKQSEPYHAIKSQDNKMMNRFFKASQQVVAQQKIMGAGLGVILLILSPIWTYAQTVSLQINNIQSTKGQICIAVFENQQQFATEQPAYALHIPKTNVKNGSMTVDIPLKEGEYGISVLDDENLNGKMNYKLSAIPDEGFGFSDYNHTGIKKPLFKNFKFKILKNEIKKIKVKLRYIF